MMIRNRPGVLTKRNSDLVYFANVRIAANMAALMETGHVFFDQEYTDNLILMTPAELNRLLDEARRQGKYQ